MIHIVIPVFNRWYYTQACLKSLQSQEYKNFKIIVVDHGSTDSTSQHICKEFPNVILLNGNESMWWTAATNMGVKYALDNNADFILTLNNDLIVENNYLDSLISLYQKYPKTIIGSVSVDKRNPSNTVYAGTKWNKWTAKYRSSIQLSQYEILKKNHTFFTSDLLPGRGTLIPKEAFIALGLFDEKNFPHYAADEEFSNRCKNNGYQLVVASQAIVYSEVDATGLKNVHLSKTMKYWQDLFFSMRSPNNLRRRWLWAKLNTPIPFLYFLFDISRMTTSKFIKQ